MVIANMWLHLQKKIHPTYYADMLVLDNTITTHTILLCQKLDLVYLPDATAWVSLWEKQTTFSVLLVLPLPLNGK